MAKGRTSIAAPGSWNLIPRSFRKLFNEGLKDVTGQEVENQFKVGLDLHVQPGFIRPPQIGDLRDADDLDRTAGAMDLPVLGSALGMLDEEGNHKGTTRAAASTGTAAKEDDIGGLLVEACFNGEIDKVRHLAHSIWQKGEAMPGLLDAPADLMYDIDPCMTLYRPPLTPLQAAAMGGELEVLEYLLADEYHIDVNRQEGEFKLTALMYATMEASVQMINKLIEKKADLDIADAYGQTAMHYACHSEMHTPTEQLATVKALLAAGADTSKLNCHGYTALMVLCQSAEGGSETARALLEAPRTYHAQARGTCLLETQSTKHMETAAHIAIRSGNLKQFSVLLEFDAPLFLMDCNEQTVLEAALLKVEFAKEVLKHPTMLKSLALLLHILSQFNKYENDYPAFGEEFRQLANQTTDLCLSLLDGCDARKGHFLVLGLNVQPELKWADTTSNALETALDVNCKPFLAHRTVQEELRHTWLGHSWCPEKKTFLPADTMWRYLACPRSSMMLFNAFYISFLFLLSVYASAERDVSWPFAYEEIGIYFYIAGFTVKEMASVWRQGSDYLDDHWNFLDLGICLLSITSFVMRASVPNDPSSEYSDWYSLVLGSSMILAFSRVLVVFNVDRNLGPLQLMLASMVKDVVMFVIMASVFLCGFAFALYVMYAKYNPEVFGSVSDSAVYLYWGTMGEISLPDLDVETSDLVTSYGKILFGAYIMLSMVVLINLLIALMSSTYERIQVNIDVEWKAAWAMMVYFLTEEQSLLEVAPPLNLFFVPLHFFKETKDSAKKKLKLTRIAEEEVEEVEESEDSDSLENIEDAKDLLRSAQSEGKARVQQLTIQAKKLAKLGGNKLGSESVKQKQKKALKLFQEVAREWEVRKIKAGKRTLEKQVELLVSQHNQLRFQFQTLFDTLLRHHNLDPTEHRFNPHSSVDGIPHFQQDPSFHRTQPKLPSAIVLSQDSLPPPTPGGPETVQSSAKKQTKLSQKKFNAKKAAAGTRTKVTRKTTKTQTLPTGKVKKEPSIRNKTKSVL